MNVAELRVIGKLKSRRTRADKTVMRSAWIGVGIAILIGGAWFLSRSRPTPPPAEIPEPQLSESEPFAAATRCATRLASIRPETVIPRIVGPQFGRVGVLVLGNSKNQECGVYAFSKSEAFFHRFKNKTGENTYQLVIPGEPLAEASESENDFGISLQVRTKNCVPTHAELRPNQQPETPPRCTDSEPCRAVDFQSVLYSIILDDIKAVMKNIRDQKTAGTGEKGLLALRFCRHELVAQAPENKEPHPDLGVLLSHIEEAENELQETQSE